jgi:hypothetical protein
VLFAAALAYTATYYVLCMNQALILEAITQSSHEANATLDMEI